MITASMQYGQSIEDMQTNVHAAIAEAKSRMAHPGSIRPRDLEALNKAAEKINSVCERIISLLSSHDISKPDSFPLVEKLKLKCLNDEVIQCKEYFDSKLSEVSGNMKRI